jgi:hypothetical protein
MINRNLPWYKRIYWYYVLYLTLVAGELYFKFSRSVVKPIRLMIARRKHPEVVQLAKRLK